MEHEQEKADRERHPATERKSYASPRLIDYGPVSKLTQGTSTRSVDSTPGALLRRRN